MNHNAGLGSEFRCEWNKIVNALSSVFTSRNTSIIYVLIRMGHIVLNRMFQIL